MQQTGKVIIVTKLRINPRGVTSSLFCLILSTHYKDLTWGLFQWNDISVMPVFNWYSPVSKRDSLLYVFHDDVWVVILRSLATFAIFAHLNLLVSKSRIVIIQEFLNLRHVKGHLNFYAQMDALGKENERY